MSQNQNKSLSKIFICRFNTNFLHILSSPKVLPCGNTACNECIIDSIDKNGQIKCNFDKCKLKHDIKNVNDLVKNVVVEEALDENILTIGNHIIQKLKKKFNTFKGKL